MDRVSLGREGRRPDVVFEAQPDDERAPRWPSHARTLLPKRHGWPRGGLASRRPRRAVALRAGALRLPAPFGARGHPAASSCARAGAMRKTGICAAIAWNSSRGAWRSTGMCGRAPGASAR